MAVPCASRALPCGVLVGLLLVCGCPARREAPPPAPAVVAAPSPAPAASPAPAEEPAARMKKALRFRVVDKGFSAKDIDAGRPDSLLFVNAEYENTSGEEILGFSGDVEFKDDNGNPVMGGKIKVTTPLAPGARGTWRAQKVFDAFNDDDVKMKESNLAKVRMYFTPRGVHLKSGLLGDSP